MAGPDDRAHAWQPAVDRVAGVAHDVARPAPGKRTLVGDAPDDATPDRAAGGGVPAWRYVEQTLHLVLAAIGARIARVGLVAPHPHLTWAAAPRAASMISAAIRAYVEAAPGRALKRLMMLAQPADLSAVVGAARNGRPGTAWLPEVGLAIGEAFDAPLVAAVHRMGARLRAQLDGDAHGVMPARGALLVASCPLDAVIADVLVAPGLVVDRGAGGGAGGGAGVGAVGASGDALPHGAVEVEYEWLGARDPALWNWIRVTSPRDATAEHVARTPLAGGIVLDGSEQAHRIAASPPYFAIPIETARLVPAAWKHAPDTVKVAARRGDLGPRFADGGALAESTLADEAALAQASGGVASGGVASGGVASGGVASGGVASGGVASGGVASGGVASGGGPSGGVASGGMASGGVASGGAVRAGAAGGLASLAHALERAEIQVAFLKAQLAPWRAHLALGGIQMFLLRRAAERARDRRALARWAGVLPAVERIVHAAASEASALLADLARRGATPADADALGPVLDVVRAYAHAAGVAHLAAEAPAALTAARQRAAQLPIALAEDRIRLARGAVAEQQRAQRAAGRVEERAGEPIAAVPGLATRAADLRLTDARGGGVDGESADELAADADEVALRAQIATLQTQLATAERRADAVQLHVENAGGWTVQQACAIVRGEARSWLAQLDRTRDPHRVEAAPGVSARRARIDGARRTIAAVRHQMVQLAHKAEIDRLLQAAYAQTQDRKLRDALDAIALQIGSMIVTGELVGAGVAAVRGVVLAREGLLIGDLIADVRAVRLGYQALELTGHAAALTAVQGATGGPTGAAAFADNLAGLALAGAVLRPFRAFLGEAADLEAELRTWAGTARATGKAAAGAALELGAGIASAGAAHGLVHGAAPHAAGADDLVVQGLALAATKLVHRHTQAMRDRLVAAFARKPSPAAQALLHEIDALAHAAAAGEAKAGRAPAHLRDIDPADMAADLADIVAQARRLLVEQGLLLTREAALYDAADQPAAKAQTAADQAHLAGAFLEVPFRLAGLQPVVDGFVYEGTPAQIAKAFADADQLGAPAPRTRDAKTGTWHVTSGDARFEIRERADLREATERAAAATAHSVEHDAPEASSTTDPAITNTKRSSRNLPEYPIRRSSLEVQIQERPGMFRCEFIGRTLQGADVGFGSAMLELTDDGNPKGRPELTLMASYYVNGDEYALHVYDDVVMSSSGVPRGQGVRTSITRYALDEFGRIYEKHFKRPLRVWGGILAWENLLHFQREYVALRRNGMERKQALEAAVKETSFGRHRVEAGFTVLGIDATDDALIDLRDGRGPQLAPTRVEVFARKP